MASLPELELSKLSGTSAGEGVERQQQEEEDLRAPAATAVAPPAAEPGMSAAEPSQLVGSSAGAGIARQEEEDNDLGSPAAAAAVPPPVPVADPAADRSAPELAGSSSGEGIESQEEEDDARSPSAAAAAAAPLLSAPNTANRSAPESGQLAGSSAGREVLEGGLVFMPNPMAVRYVYGALCAIMTIVAWIVRDIELPRFDDHYGCDGSHDRIAANGVLRVSMGLAKFFFLVMFVTTLNTRKRYEFRNFWHCRWWILKAAIFSIGYGFATYTPSSLLKYYGMVAHVGSWLFLVIQFFSMTSFIMWVNEWCLVESNREKWAQMTYGLLPLSPAPVVLYAGSFAGLVFMYHWYAPYCEPTTGIYIAVMASAVFLMFLISPVRKVSGGYLAPGMMMAYVVFMCWTTIRSEPHTETCNKNTKPQTDWQTILSFVIAAVVIIISTYTVGNDSKCIQFSDMIELADDVPYGYGFFHMVFASGATYIGMLFVGWNAHRTMEKWTVDVSWASTRVRATSGLVVAICYTLMLVSQELWNLMLAVTSNSTPSNNEASPVGDGVVHPVFQ